MVSMDWISAGLDREVRINMIPQIGIRTIYALHRRR